MNAQQRTFNIEHRMKDNDKKCTAKFDVLFLRCLFSMSAKVLLGSKGNNS